MARPFRGRTTSSLRSTPVYDRKRAHRSLVVPLQARDLRAGGEAEFGYFVLPILHRDRLVGRIDPPFDRKDSASALRRSTLSDGAPEDAGAAT